MQDDPYRRCVEIVLDAIADARALRGEAHVAWCGGSAATVVLDRLADADLSSTQWYLCDERCVPRGDPERNDLELHERLVGRGLIGIDALHPIPAEHGPSEGARLYDTFLANRPDFDVVFLSLGPDGHVASLFPGNGALNASGHAVGIDDSPKPPAVRVSLTVRRLRGARVRIVVAMGATKQRAARSAMESGSGPAALLEPTHWIRGDVEHSG